MTAAPLLLSVDTDIERRNVIQAALDAWGSFGCTSMRVGRDNFETKFSTKKGSEQGGPQPLLATLDPNVQNNQILTLNLEIQLETNRNDPISTAAVQQALLGAAHVRKGLACILEREREVKRSKVKRRIFDWFIS